MDGNTQPTERDQLPTPVQPGAMISPNDASGIPEASTDSTLPMLPATPTAPPRETSLPTPEVPQASPAPQPVTMPAPDLTPPPEASLNHTEEAPTPFEPSPAPAEGSANAVTWTASEFIAHHKSAAWYALLAVFAVVAAATIWLITKDTFAAVVIVLAVAILAGYAARQPRELQYAVDERGITVGRRQYPYGAFRSFSVFEDGAFSSIELMPLKRFSPPISMYYGQEDEEAITNALAGHLPFEPRERDALDKLMHKIRF